MMSRGGLLTGLIVLRGVLGTSAAAAQETRGVEPPCPGTPAQQAQHGWNELDVSHWVEAEVCLRAARGASRDPFVREHRDELRRSLRVVAQHVGGLQVNGGVFGARVYVNDVEVARLPMAGAIRVVATTVRLRVEADGYHSAERPVIISAGERPTIEAVTLEPLPQVAPPASTAPAEPEPPPIVAAPVTTPTVATPLEAPVVAAPPRVTSRAVLETPTAPPRGNTARTLAWVSAGGAVVLLGVGIAGYVLGSGAAARWNDDGVCGLQGTSTRDACLEDRQTTDTMSALTIAGLAGAGVLAVTSAVLFVASPRSAPARASMRCGGGPGMVGVSCAVRF